MAEQEIAFHRSILNRTGDVTLLGVWAAILSQVVAQFRESHLSYEDPLDIYREHAEIVEMFRTGNKDASIRFYSEKIGSPAPKPAKKIKRRQN